jgi:hypothetical protein
MSLAPDGTVDADREELREVLSALNFDRRKAYD